MTVLLLTVVLHLGEAFAAVNGSALSRLETELCFLAALVAYGGIKLSFTGRGFSLVTAGLASLRLILKSLFRVELLITRGENELLTAVLAG